MRPSDDKRHIWRSRDVEAHRGFAYYREGICRSFMDLIPEPAGGDDWEFSGSIETIRIAGGRLNRVVATSHLVLRTKAEIARSPAECFYLNYKTRGECRISQSGSEVVIRPGDVGLFESARPFALEHRRKPDLAVSSFMLPFEALADRLPNGLPTAPLLLSRHPTLGHLIRETAATLAREADLLSEPEAAKLYSMMLDLVAMVIAKDSHVRSDVSSTHSNALFLAIRSFVDAHFAKSGLTPRSVAETFRVSTRYLHRLFEEAGTTFGTYLLVRRLEAASSDLAAPAKVHLTIAEIGLRAGFCDPAHFHRAFKARYGCTAGDWRRSALWEISSLNEAAGPKLPVP